MSRFSAALILIAIAALVGYFLLRPQWAGIQVDRLEIQRLHDVSKELEDLIALRDDLIAEYASIPDEDFRKIQDAVPDGFATGDYLVDLETIAQRNGMALTQVDFTTTRPGAAASAGAAANNRYATLPIALAVNGTYTSFRSFLADIERNLRLTEVNSMTFSGVGSTQPFGISLSGEIYYR